MLIGCVGKPSAGKSTFLNALVGEPIAKTAPHKFTTIKPNMGVGHAYKMCVCREMKKNCGKCSGPDQNPMRPIPVRVIDVAGLVPGAHEGRGLGNQFLSDLSEADVLLHIIDASGSLSIEGDEVPAGSHDPIEDVKFLEEEISLWIAGILGQGWEKVKRTAKSAKMAPEDVLAERLAGIKISRPHIRKLLHDPGLNLPQKVENWTKNEILVFSKEIRKISKPIILVANKMDRPTAPKNLARLKQAFPGQIILSASALAEVALVNFHKKGKIIYDQLSGQVSLNEANLTGNEKAIIEKISNELLVPYGGTGVPKVLTEAVKALNYIVAFPVADVHKLTDNLGSQILPDVFLIPDGTTVKEFARYVHKDLYDNFICGIDSRTNRRLGDSHEIKDRDIIKIMSSK